MPGLRLTKIIGTVAAAMTACVVLTACRPVVAPAATPTTATTPAATPAYAAALQAAYGPPSDAGLGSAVFYAVLDADANLEQAALDKYKAFTGELWQRYGEAAWLGPWKEIYARAPGASGDIVAELRGIVDRDAARSVPLILDEVEDADAARAALTATYDDPAVTELRVFNLGDGAAMAGLLVAGRRGATGEATFLVFLLD